jgi:CO/xanthine dehydrogenase Mo-binding subunit
MEGRESKIIGERFPKVEALRKATGELKFSGDIFFPNMLHAKILRSPYAHAKIKHIDVSKALKLTGVKAAITHKDVPKIPTMHQFLHVPSHMYYDSFLLEEKVRHYGDRVAAVAATTPEIAEEALELIHVEYEPLPAVLDPLESIREGAAIIHNIAWRGGKAIEIRNNIVGTREIEIGNVEKGFREADLVIENVFKTSRPNNAPLERTTVICVPGSGGGIEIYGTTQGIHAMRMNIASSLGLPLHKVNCHRVYLGGSFGAHIHTGWIEPIGAFLALMTGRPVRGEKSREEMFLSCGRHPMIMTLKTGAKKDGTLTAQYLDVIDETGAYAVSGESKMVLAGGWFFSMYKCPNLKFTGKTVYTNTPPLTAMRGAGNPQVNFAVESQMDIIAGELEMDPVALRLKNHIDKGDTFYGQGPDVICVVQSCGTAELLIKGAKAIGWHKRNDHETNRPWVRRGIGMARGFHTSGAGSPKPSKFIMDYSGAIVKMNEDGTAVLINAAADTGGGSLSAHAAIVAEELGLNYEDVLVYMGDTEMTLFDVPTHASRGTYGAGLAVKKASEKIKQILLTWAAKILEASVEDLLVGEGKILVAGDPKRWVTIKEVVQTAQTSGWGSVAAEVSLRPDACPPHFTVCFVEVEVDTQTGHVKILRAITGADVGTPINRNGVEGQIAGGLHMGLGFALLEDTRFDKNTGRLLNPNFRDYKTLTSLDMPQIEMIIADTFEPSGPFGAKGVGEGATNPVAAAVANAIYNAVGVRIKDLPISVEKILKVLNKREISGNIK